jgi:DNA processing protein
MTDTIGDGLAFAAALAALPMMGPARLAALLERWPPREAWVRVSAGRVERDDGVRRTFRSVQELASGVSAWRAAAASVDPVAAWPRYRAAGVDVVLLGSPAYPAALAADPEPPAVLFVKGSLAVLDGPRVGIVGTRRCTHAGREIACDLGHDLAAAGVRVVSGLAAGIDGAAHSGALAAGAAPPIGVVGSGLDVVYPPRHAALWASVGDAGLLLSEAPLGGRPEPWRFPARNRIIAGLSDVVVVVESHARGGSRYTADEAIARGRTVMAVPGSVRSSAATFTNELLAECCPPARDAADVLVALGLAVAGDRRTHADARPAPSDADSLVLDQIGGDSVGLEQLVTWTGLDPVRVSVSIAHLEAAGWIGGDGGQWRRL